jgi:hypothetical protein
MSFPSLPSLRIDSSLNLGMSTFFRGIAVTFRVEFIPRNFSERNSVANPYETGADHVRSKQPRGLLRVRGRLQRLPRAEQPHRKRGLSTSRAAALSVARHRRDEFLRHGGDAEAGILRGRVSSKQTKINFGSNRNKPKQYLFRVCFVKSKTKNFGLFRCFEPKSKQPKQTELFRNKLKQTETTLHFLKIPKYTFF